MRKKTTKPAFDKTTLDYFFEGIIIFMTVFAAIILCIYMDDMKMQKANSLDKYDSITVKLPKEEKVVFFNDVPKRTYFNELGFLTVEY